MGYLKAAYVAMARGGVVANSPTRRPLVNRVVKFVNSASIKKLCLWFTLMLVALSFLIGSVLISTGWFGHIDSTHLILSCSISPTLYYFRVC